VKSLVTRTLRLALLPAVLALSAASTARADSLFTNFGSPGQTYQTGVGYAVGLDAPGTNIALALPFIPSESATLTDAMLALFEVGPTAAVNVFVESDSGGQPGAILDTLTTAGTLGSTASIFTYTCSTCPQLVGGTEYFLVAQNITADLAAWNWSNSQTGTVYFNDAGSNTASWSSASEVIPAFAVDGAPAGVPEPASVILMSTMLLAVAFAARRLAARTSR
jgi:hypothetical protein